MRIVSLMLGAPLLVATVALAGPPRIENAVFESTPLEGSLSSRVAVWSETVQEPSWLGWHVPMVKRGGRLCCWTRGDYRSQNQACALESTHRHFVFSSDRPDVSMDSETLVVLLRAANGRLEEMRVYSDGCRLDAGGKPVIWIEGVGPEESVGLLSQWIEDDSVVKDEALMAMALHATQLATDRLTGIARQSSDAEIRGEALFWLSHTGATEAPDTILQALAADPDPAVREEAIFALSQLPDPQGTTLLLEILQDPSRPSEIRQRAFFWYVQSGDDQALDLIAEILGN